MMKVLARGEIESVLNRLAENADVFVPMQRGPQTGFFSWKTYDDYSDDLMLDILNVYLPPKNIILPPAEKMHSSQNEGAKINLDKVYQDIEARIILGIRGCDVQAMDFMDDVFLIKGYAESYYKARRDKTTIIANACYYPGPSCFCTSMGANPTDPALADVIIRAVGKDGYVWETKNVKGQIVTDKIADLLEEKEVVLPEVPQLSCKVDYEGVAAKLKDMFEHPLWEKHSEPCQTCAICTYSCPTCHCFDIQVKTWGDEGYSFGCYDSCMYRGYSIMTGRDNPREAARDRFRNRFLHKLEFYPERYGKPLCTGCGRCVALCPAGVSMVKMIHEIKEVD